MVSCYMSCHNAFLSKWFADYMKDARQWTSNFFHGRRRFSGHPWHFLRGILRCFYSTSLFSSIFNRYQCQENLALLYSTLLYSTLFYYSLLFLKLRNSEVSHLKFKFHLINVYVYNI